MGLIGREGHDAVTLRAVAAEARLSVGAISHYFSSRDGLIEATLRFAARRELERLRRMALDLQGRVFDRDDWVAAVARWYGAEIEKDREGQLACFELFLASARDPRYRTAVADWHETYLGLAELALRTAGSLRPKQHARLFVALIAGVGLVQLSLAEVHFERDILRPLLKELVDALVRPRRDADSPSEGSAPRRP